jgi:hypothetical protein
MSTNAPEFTSTSQGAETVPLDIHKDGLTADILNLKDEHG